MTWIPPLQWIDALSLFCVWCYDDPSILFEPPNVDQKDHECAGERERRLGLKGGAVRRRSGTMTTAPIGYSRVLPGTERPGHGSIHRSLHSARNPIPSDPSNREDPFVGLAQPEAESSFHSFQRSCQQHHDLPCLGHRPIVNGEAQAYAWFTYGQVRFFGCGGSK